MLAEINQWVSRLQAQLAEMVEFNASAEETVDLLTQVPRAGMGLRLAMTAAGVGRIEGIHCRAARRKCSLAFLVELKTNEKHVFWYSQRCL